MTLRACEIYENLGSMLNGFRDLNRTLGQAIGRALS